MFTRRCTQRQFLMRPDRLTEQAYWYCFAEAALEVGMDAYWALAHTNQTHYGLGDPGGVYPDFLRRFHGNFAKVMNALRGRRENFWASGVQTSVVECVEPKDTLDKMVYSLTNVVKDGLVDRAGLWPGATSLGYQLRDKELVVRRPHWYFDPEGKMPEEVRLKFVRPKGFEHLSQEEWADVIRREVRVEEERAAEKRRRKGQRVRGRKAVLRQNPFGKPKSREPRRKLSPRVACKNKWRRIDALKKLAVFARQYREALAAFKGGDRDVIFPAGTWKLHRELGVARHPA